MASKVTCINIPSGETVTGTVTITAPVLDGSNTGNTSASLSWTQSVGALKDPLRYIVEQDNVVIANISTLTLSVTGLTANTSYSFKVLAEDALGHDSSFSNIKVIHTPV